MFIIDDVERRVAFWTSSSAAPVYVDVLRHLFCHRRSHCRFLNAATVIHIL